MSKMDNLRAMREARYAQAAKGPAKADETTKRPSSTAPTPVARRLAMRPPSVGRPQAPVGRRLATRPSTADASPPVARKASAAPKGAASAPKGSGGKAPKAPAAGPTAAEPAAVAEELCGHRNMSGRTCTREKAHAAKSHRYS